MKSLWGAPERRAITMNDWIKGVEVGGARTSSNVTVNADTAFGIPAVLRAVRLLADTVSTLPVHAYRGSGSARIEMPTQPKLVTTPSLVLSLEEWLQQAMVSLLMWGNAYGVILQRDRFGVPITIEWVAPDTVSVEQESALRPPSYRLSGQLADGDDIIHIRAFLKPGSVVGSAPLSMLKETFGIGLAAQKFGAQWFGDGGHPSAILTSDSPITEEQAATMKARFVAAIRGKREPAVLGAGLGYQPIQVNADESQFLETQQAVVNDVARAFGLPAEMIGGQSSGQSVTYANREQSAIDFLTFSVNPWLVRIERALSSALPNGQYVKFNPDALLRTDTRNRYEAHTLALQSHFKTISEVRELEDLPPLDNGEDFPPSGAGTPGPKPGSDGGADSGVRAISPEELRASDEIEQLNREIERMKRGRRLKVIRDDDGFATSVEESFQ